MWIKIDILIQNKFKSDLAILLILNEYFYYIENKLLLNPGLIA